MDLTVDGDTEVEIEVFSSTVVKSEEVKTEETAVDVEVHNKPTQEVSRVCSLNRRKVLVCSFPKWTMVGRPIPRILVDK